MKADRLDGYAANRNRDANAFQNAAREIGQRFEFGQPILTGHHSERRARKDHERMDSNMKRAVKASKLADYWAYRAESVERHANYKNRPAVRARRIKTLLKELREWQRAISDAHHALGLWEKVAAREPGEERDKAIKHLAGFGNYSPYFGLWDELRKGEKTTDEAVEIAIQRFTNGINSEYRKRWIEHTLNRLGYETAMLGEIARYDDELSAAILQRFCRTHGADKPKALKTATGWQVTSPVPLPARISDGKTIELTEDDWRDLMQSCGYDVIANQPRQSKRTTLPLLNIDTDEHLTHHYRNNDGVDKHPVIHMTKEDYKWNTKRDNTRIYASLCGQYRFRAVFVPHATKMFCGAWKAVFLTDSKAHPKPKAPADQEAA